MPPTESNPARIASSTQPLVAAPTAVIIDTSQPTGSRMVHVLDITWADDPSYWSAAVDSDFGPQIKTFSVYAMIVGEMNMNALVHEMGKLCVDSRGALHRFILRMGDEAGQTLAEREGGEYSGRAELAPTPGSQGSKIQLVAQVARKRVMMGQDSCGFGKWPAHKM
ncbi:hypothetical protein BJ508DRAFT_304892 [Ascobolus immersus RN42]|uniref:Uncharacterized protein n=1 Tax=Ascobolus immersus RN42 TaxID=1160509 RepID=A0A3N4IAN8_ASCIM|nr:hypothetical protein BJ508DRAFT_304892 [Ascobolus immersus RN42]